MLVPALGGSERVLAETVVAYARTDWLPYGQGIDWSPDGKYVAFSSRGAEDGPSRIVMMSPDSGERQELTSPPAGTFGDGMPRFSPDGKTLAFFRRLPDLYWKIGVISLSSTASKVTFIEAAGKHPYMPPFAWTRDSRELVGPLVWMDAESRLWRVPADGHTPPVPVVGAIGSATDVAVAPQGGYLAYSRSEEDTNIWRLELTPKGPSSAPVTLISSTRFDGTPEYSPDGRRILFASGRSGHTEIWVCDADGSNPTQVTQMRAPESGSPRWSPDGRTIAFDSDREGQAEIYTVTADGGPPRRLTDHAGADFVPTWSRDGRWVYFTSDRSGSRQIWKVPAEGGTPGQVTRHGGVNAFESEDGRTLYYVKDIEAAGLWKMPMSGGEEVQVLDVPEPRRWGAVAYVSGGVYYIARERAVERVSPWAIFFHEFASGKTVRVAPIDKPLGYFARALAVSPDRRWLLFNQVDTRGSDLMLLENFR
jgi:Tol biopolymer transport system component